VIYIGIDPGASGAIAIINDTGCGLDVAAHKLDGMTYHDIAILLLETKMHGNTAAVIERVSSMPKQGVSSTFKFGKIAGALEMALASTLITYRLVTPQTWQKTMGCMSKGDKNITKAAAQRLFPSMKITHAIADALLIAEYCRRTHV